MRMKTVLRPALAICSLAAVGIAQAGPIDPLLQAGQNTIEDRSGEVTYRCNTSLAPGSQCEILDNGQALNPIPIDLGNGDQIFDMFAGVLDFERINGTLTDPNQLSGLIAVKFDGLAAGGGGIGSVFNQSAVGSDIFNEIFGFDLTSVAMDKGDAEDTLGVFFQDASEDTDAALTSGTFGSAVLAAQQGSLAAVAGIVDGDDFFQARLLNPGGGIVGGGAAGDTDILFDLAFALSFQAYELTGTFVENDPDNNVTRLSDFANVIGDIVGTGSNTKAAGQEVNAGDPNAGLFNIGNDIQAQFVRLPEPAMLGMLGMSVLVVGAVARRRRQAA